MIKKRRISPKEELLNFISIFTCFSLFILGIYIFEKSNSYLVILLVSFIFFSHQKLTSEWLHEASHWGICNSKKLNDQIANIFLTPFWLVSIKSYRTNHFNHHKKEKFFDASQLYLKIFCISLRIFLYLNCL